MHTSVARRVRASFLLAALAVTLTLFAGASAAAHPTVTPPDGTPPTMPCIIPLAEDSGSRPNTLGDPDGTIGIGLFDPPIPWTDGAVHVTPVPCVTDAHPVAIDHISVGADGVTLTIYWYGGVEACYSLSEVLVSRDADGLLAITVLEGTNPNLGVDMACIELAQLKATTITLDAPLFRDGSQIWDQ